MEITKVNVKKVSCEGSKLLGHASITIDDCFVVRGIRIIQGKERVFIAMPRNKDIEIKNNDYAFPINHETRIYVEECILSEFNKVESDES